MKREFANTEVRGNKFDFRKKSAWFDDSERISLLNKNLKSR